MPLKNRNIHVLEILVIRKMNIYLKVIFTIKNKVKGHKTNYRNTYLGIS